MITLRVSYATVLAHKPRRLLPIVNGPQFERKVLGRCRAGGTPQPADPIGQIEGLYLLTDPAQAAGDPTHPPAEPSSPRGTVRVKVQLELSIDRHSDRVKGLNELQPGGEGKGIFGDAILALQVPPLGDEAQDTQLLQKGLDRGELMPLSGPQIESQTPPRGFTAEVEEGSVTQDTDQLLHHRRRIREVVQGGKAKDEGELVAAEGEMVGVPTNSMGC